MFCSISGTTPEEPVISSKTGHLFEKSLITKALQVSRRHHVHARSDYLASIPAQILRTSLSPHTSFFPSSHHIGNKSGARGFPPLSRTGGFFLSFFFFFCPPRLESSVACGRGGGLEEALRLQ